MKIKQGTSKTPYELWFGHIITMKYIRISGSRCYIEGMMILGSLTLEVMKVCSLDIHWRVSHIDVLVKD